MHTTLLSELESLRLAPLDAGLVFSGKASSKTLQGFASPSSLTPTINPDYLFHENSRDIIVWLMTPGDPLYVFGPVGCGKTSCIKQLAARLNYPVFEVTGHGRLEFADLVGHLTVKDGNMVYEYGPLALAMRYGGLVLLNEIDLTSPEVAAGLNTVLDGSPLCVAENGGELITPHPLFRFAATANTNGGGDDTGLYQGTQRQNLAWLDRFVMCEMGYPAPEVEKALLDKRFPTLPDPLRSRFVEFAGEVRKLFMGESDTLTGAIEVTLSTRTLLRWAELTIRFQPLAHQGLQPVTYALDRALGYRATRETRAMLHELAQRIFPRQEDVPHFTERFKDMDDSTFLELALRNHLNTASPDPSAIPLVLLNQTSNNSAGGKFWQGTVTPDGLNLNWGRWNTAGQKMTIAVSDCINGSPVQELFNRALGKIQGGYALERTNLPIPQTSRSN